ncbi:ribonuclease III [Peptococcaceae bacterium]|nr:ribonuclease III [Peptococcaceae bacterium]
MDKNNKKSIDIIKRLGINWNDVKLLNQALTHSSYASDKKNTVDSNNQRLEFLGDAVLELVISEYLYKSYPHYTEGELTKLRAAIVCEPSLVRAASNLSLGEFIFMGKGEERSGGRKRPSILADAFEALLGAIYIDQGLDTVREFALRALSPIIKDVTSGKAEKDYKTDLQELIQKYSKDPLSYVIIKEEGPDHAKKFTAAVIYKGKEIGRGHGRSKKEAEQCAAKKALREYDKK